MRRGDHIIETVYIGVGAPLQALKMHVTTYKRLLGNWVVVHYRCAPRGSALRSLRHSKGLATRTFYATQTTTWARTKWAKDHVGMSGRPCGHPPRLGDTHAFTGSASSLGHVTAT